MTDVEVDVETILQDAAAPPVCAVETCDAPARWLGIMTCGHDGMWCEAHRQIVVDGIEQGWMITCHNSGHRDALPVEVDRWVEL